MRAYNESLEGERRRAKRGRSFKRGRLSENTARTRTILAEKKAWTDLFSFQGSARLGQNKTYADPLSSWALRRRVNTLLTRPLNSPVMNVAEQRAKARLSSPPPPLAARCYKQLNKRAGHERAPRKFMRRAGGSIRASKDHATCFTFLCK